MKLLDRLTTCIKKVYFIYNNSNAFVFEYDEVKSKVNLTKHGIDFVVAKKLWDDDDAMEIDLNTEGEPRFLHVGKISETLYSAVCTLRKDRIRLISVRRARKKEVLKYEENKSRRTR